MRPAARLGGVLSPAARRRRQALAWSCWSRPTCWTLLVARAGARPQGRAPPTTRPTQPRRARLWALPGGARSLDGSGVRCAPSNALILAALLLPPLRDALDPDSNGVARRRAAGGAGDRAGARAAARLAPRQRAGPADPAGAPLHPAVEATRAGGSRGCRPRVPRRSAAARRDRLATPRRSSRRWPAARCSLERDRARRRRRRGEADGEMRAGDRVARRRRAATAARRRPRAAARDSARPRGADRGEAPRAMRPRPAPPAGRVRGRARHRRGRCTRTPSRTSRRLAVARTAPGVPWHRRLRRSLERPRHAAPVALGRAARRAAPPSEPRLSRPSGSGSATPASSKPRRRSWHESQRPAGGARRRRVVAGVGQAVVDAQRDARPG